MVSGRCCYYQRDKKIREWEAKRRERKNWIMRKKIFIPRTFYNIRLNC